MVAEIRGALDQYPREQLQEILAWVFKEYVVEGGTAPAQSALAMLDARTELEGLVVRRAGDVAAAAPRRARAGGARRAGRARQRARGRALDPDRGRGAGRASAGSPPSAPAAQPAADDDAGDRRRRSRRRRRTPQPSSHQAPPPSPPNTPVAPAPTPATTPAADEQERREEGRRRQPLLVARGGLMSAPGRSPLLRRAARSSSAPAISTPPRSRSPPPSSWRRTSSRRASAPRSRWRAPIRRAPPSCSRTGLRGLTARQPRRLVLVALGDVLTAAGDFPGADEAYAQASQLPGRHPLASRLARLQAKTGRYAEALATLPPRLRRLVDPEQDDGGVVDAAVGQRGAHQRVARLVERALRRRRRASP